MVVVSVGTDLLGVWVHRWKPVGVASMLLSIHIDKFRLSLMFFRLTPKSIRDHLSLKSMNSLALSSAVISGLCSSYCNWTLRFGQCLVGCWFW